MAKKPFDINEICEKFAIEGEFTGYEKINNGHINSTYNLVFENNGKIVKYVLQKINTVVFKNPDGLMSNIVAVTKHIAKKNAERNIDDADRRTLTFLPCVDGKYYYVDKEGGCWRLYYFVDYVYTCNTIDSEEVFNNAGVAFGEFQNLLADFDGSSLFETIEKFHNTASRFENLKKAIEENTENKNFA